MKIVLNKKALTVNPDRFLRRAGYAFIRDRNTGKESYARHLGRGRYPRLHMYFKDVDDRVTFDLHLDQKYASYEGSNMHNAEYDGEIVEVEIDRLKNLLRGETASPANFQNENNQEENKNHLKQMGEGQISNLKQKKPWWKNVFGI